MCRGLATFLLPKWDTRDTVHGLIADISFAFLLSRIRTLWYPFVLPYPTSATYLFFNF